MEMTYLDERKEQDAFAERAAENFALHPEHWTFTDGDIAAGEYFALRFGMGGDCVVIFRIGEETPINYQNIIKRDS
jgi:hypothetical protein